MKISALMETNHIGDYFAPDYDVDVVHTNMTDKPSVRVSFGYKNKHVRQRGGQIIIPASVAAWLGRSLIAASSEGIKKAELTLQMRGEKEF